MISEHERNLIKLLGAAAVGGIVAIVASFYGMWMLTPW